MFLRRRMMIIQILFEPSLIRSSYEASMTISSWGDNRLKNHELFLLNKNPSIQLFTLKIFHSFRAVQIIAIVFFSKTTLLPNVSKGWTYKQENLTLFVLFLVDSNHSTKTNFWSVFLKDKICSNMRRVARQWLALPSLNNMGTILLSFPTTSVF